MRNDFNIHKELRLEVRLLICLNILTTIWNIYVIIRTYPL